MKLIRGRLLLGEAAARGTSSAGTGGSVKRVDQTHRAWASRMSAEVTGLRVMPLGYRWGPARPAATSASTGRPCSSATLIDYVLVHELAHLERPDHGPEFWRIVDRAMTGYEERRERLRRFGPQLWLPDEGR